jgi:cell division protein FtsL
MRQQFQDSIILPLGIVLLLFLTMWAMFHVWSRHMVTELGYSISEHQSRKEHLLFENNALKLEISTLKSSKRLELIAEKQLGLAAPKPEQVVYLWLDD